MNMNAFRLCHQLRLFIILFFVTINISIVFYYFFLPSIKYHEQKEHLSQQEYLEQPRERNKLVHANQHHRLPSVSNGLHDMALYPSSQRLNTLLRLLHEKERVYGATMDRLRLLRLDSFEMLVSKDGAAPTHTQNEPIDSPQHMFKREITAYLHRSDVAPHDVLVDRAFVEQLIERSRNFSFGPPPPPQTAKLTQRIANDNRPVIVTAANNETYESLQAAIYHVHLYLPAYAIIVYDLGLTDEMRQKTKKKCKCQLRRFDADSAYATVSPHVADLSTQSWKPLIIQEVLRDYQLMVYIDTTVRFHSGALDSLLNAAKQTGLKAVLRRGASASCYTSASTYAWFGEEPHQRRPATGSDTSAVDLVQTDILVLYRSFVTSLVVKTWVTCALDADCIAPRDASATGGLLNRLLFGCHRYCGCHRYDQSAISLAIAYFYGYPKHAEQFPPAFAFSSNDTQLFSINRQFGLHYF